jgi:4-amino-4-deoxy-L-arabinose transferase-like glycosyltransferase
MTLFAIENPQSKIGGPRHWAFSILPALLIALLAFAVRVPHVGRLGFELDEASTLELSSGRGQSHKSLPVNIVFQAPQLWSLAGAPPWWRVWTRMECTHPPLYVLMLRLWESVLGDGDTVVRLYSVLASTIAVVLLYDVARLLNGPAIATWAAVLMALAQPEVQYAREAVSYAMLQMVALLAADALVRIEVLGFNRRRLFGLVAALLATLLTHYFCIGALAALGLYALIRLSGPTRAKTIGAFIAVAIIFIVIWGPFMWHQRIYFFNPIDTQFLLNDGPDHIQKTLWQLALVPTRLLAEPRGTTAGICAVTAVLFVLPFGLLKRQPKLLLWSLWMVGTVGLVAAMDLFRKTNHLVFIRYTLLAGPAVYVLIPAVFAAVLGKGWRWQIIPAAAVLSCALAVPQAYIRYEDDTNFIAKEVATMIGPRDLIVFASTGDMQWTAAAQYLMMGRYFQPLPCPIVILNAPASGPALVRARAAKSIVVFTDSEPGAPLIPGSRLVEERWYFGRGLLWRLDPNPRQ